MASKTSRRATPRPKKSLPRKSTIRLERGEGPGRVFWEIARSKTTVTTRFGKYLSAGRTVVHSYATDLEAKAACARAIEDKRKEGYGDPPAAAVIGGSSKKGVVARNPEIEAMIEESPNDPQVHLIYADWLQQQCDPRGELIIVQHGIASLETKQQHFGSSPLERAETELFKAYEEELLGPLAKYTHIRLTHRSYRGFLWRYGFIRAARIDGFWQTSTAAVLKTILGHPSTRFLERLVLMRGLDQAVIKTIAEHAPKTLEWITLGNAVSHLDLLCAAVPRLRTLILTSWLAENSGIGEARADALEELRVHQVAGSFLKALAKVSFPRLSRLHLTIAQETLAPLLSPIFQRPEAYPALSHLSVRQWMLSEYGAPITQDVVAHETVNIAVARKLDRLDLDVPLSAAAARQLCSRSTELSAIRSLRMPKDAVADKSLRLQMTAEIPALVWTEDPVEHDYGDLDEDLPVDN
jgi:uncharacterized protein (TIGR02996 family)